MLGSQDRASDKMTKCPCGRSELAAILNSPGESSPIVLELARRVLEARKRRLKENRHAGEGVSWGKRQEEESAVEYLGRMAEKARKREARSQKQERSHEKGHTRGSGDLLWERLCRATVPCSPCRDPDAFQRSCCGRGRGNQLPDQSP